MTSSYHTSDFSVGKHVEQCDPRSINTDSLPNGSPNQWNTAGHTVNGKLCNLGSGSGMCWIAKSCFSLFSMFHSILFRSNEKRLDCHITSYILNTHFTSTISLWYAFFVAELSSRIDENSTFWKTSSGFSEAFLLGSIVGSQMGLAFLHEQATEINEGDRSVVMNTFCRLQFPERRHLTSHNTFPWINEVGKDPAVLVFAFPSLSTWTICVLGVWGFLTHNLPVKNDGHFVSKIWRRAPSLTIHFLTQCQLARSFYSWKEGCLTNKASCRDSKITLSMGFGA